MATITIPQKLINNDDLIVIPRKEYERLFRVFKKKNTQLGRNLNEAIAEYKAGKFFGPFTTAEQGIRFLKSHRAEGK